MSRRVSFPALQAVAVASALLVPGACKRSAGPAAQPTTGQKPKAVSVTATAAATVQDEGRTLRTSKEVKTPFGRVRIEEFAVAEPTHADSGSLDVTYLDAQPPRRFPKALENGSFGEMEDWHVDNRFSDLPVVVSEGGGTWQGLTCSWTVLTELTPAGPVELATIETAYDDSGAAENATTDIEGKIAAVVKDQSFDVQFTGTRKFIAHYVRNGNTYKLQGDDDSKLSGC